MHIKQVLYGDNRWWKYLLSILTLFIAILVAEIPLKIFSNYKKKALGISEESFEQIMATMDFTALGMSENQIFFILCSSFILLFCALIWVLPIIHKRAALSFITGRDQFDVKRFFTGAFIWMSFASITAFILVDAENYTFNFSLSAFIPLFIIAILLVPIQTAVEEILFRGYMLQGIYNLTKNIWLALIIVTILFALAHVTNPEFDHQFTMVFIGYLTFSALFGCITIFDNGLELPIGIHTGNNLFVALLLSASDGTFNTPSIFKTNTAFLLEILPVTLIMLSCMTFITLYFIYKWKFENLKPFLAKA